MNKKLVYAHWRSKLNSCLILLWDDFTWEEKLITDKYSAIYYLKDKTIKQHIDINKAVSSHMVREDVLNYIDEKVKELEL